MASELEPADRQPIRVTRTREEATWIGDLTTLWVLIFVFVWLIAAVALITFFGAYSGFLGWVLFAGALVVAWLAPVVIVVPREARHNFTQTPIEPRHVQQEPSRWVAGIAAILGLWLIISPWVLGFGRLVLDTPFDQFVAVTVSDVLVGLAVVLLGAARAFGNQLARALKYVDWAIVALGVWVFLSAFFLVPGDPFTVTGEPFDAQVALRLVPTIPSSQAAAWNNIILGLSIAALAAWNAWVAPGKWEKGSKTRA